MNGVGEDLVVLKSYDIWFSWKGKFKNGVLKRGNACGNYSPWFNININYENFIGNGEYQTYSYKCIGWFKESNVGESCWHGTCEINYHDGTILEADYQMNKIEGHSKITSYKIH